jgi:hypothetical protein
MTSGQIVGKMDTQNQLNVPLDAEEDIAGWPGTPPEAWGFPPELVQPDCVHTPIIARYGPFGAASTPAAVTLTQCRRYCQLDSGGEN